MTSRKLKYYAYATAPRLAAAVHRLLLRRRSRSAPRAPRPPGLGPTLAIEQAKALRECCTGAESPEELVDLVLRHPLVAPSQQRSEIVGLVEVVRGLRPKVLCEIGSAGGGTLFLFSAVADPAARLLSIDVGSNAEVVEKFRHLVRPGQQLLCLGADSHDPGTLQSFREWLGADRLDFLFIDGDHSHGGVAADYRDYAPFVRPGGVVALHDIVPDFKTRYGIDTGTHAGGVPEFWRSLKRGRAGAREFVDHRLQDGCGIGVLEAGPADRA